MKKRHPFTATVTQRPPFATTVSKRGPVIAQIRTDDDIDVFIGGSPGPAGPPGPQGPPGISAVQQQYDWKTVTDASDPGQGFIKADATGAAITTLYASVYASNGAVALTLASLDPGDLLWIYEAGDIARSVKFTVNNPVVVTNNQWMTIPVSVTQLNNFAPGNNDDVLVLPAPQALVARSYVHDQMVPADTWVIVHNLGFYPAGIRVEDSAGSDVEGDVTHDSTNQVTLRFGSAFSGRALLS